MLLARRLDFGPEWANSEGDDFPYYVFAEFADARPGGGGMSWWSVEKADSDSLARVAAAIYLKTQSNLESVEFRCLDSQVFDQLGLTLQSKKSDVPDEELAHHHIDLVDVKGPVVLELAKAVRDADPIPLKAARVAESVIEGLLANRFEPKIINKNGLSHLRSMGHLSAGGVKL